MSVPVPREGLSRPARWRIVSLVVVHLLIAAHVIHWQLAGRSLSSIQLSDAGRFASEGVATAALFLFAVLLVVTLLFGRIFCSWACHMLALQEACRWMLGKLGVRPKLMPSRLLWLVPFGAAFYAFLLPVVERLWLGVPFPTPQLALTSNHLWANLPGPVEAVAAILVGGLTMVYLLGSLSFCKYVCPYGAVFAVADNLALGRIRLTGECDACARCTAACTTGVRVHEEVLRLGMVANSGCMRCFECVSACPQEALAYRLGRPALTAGSRAGLTHYAFSWPEEGGLIGLFGLSFVALHGVYNAVPLLLALAVSGVIAYLGVLAARVVVARRPVQVRGIALTRAGHWSPAGGVVVGIALAALVLVGHSAVVQYHDWRASAALGELGFPRARASYSDTEVAVASRAAAHLDFCSRYGLVDTADWNMKLAWLFRSLEPQRVETYLRRVIALDPTQAAARFNLGKELARQGRATEAAEAYREAVRLTPSLAQFVPVQALKSASPADARPQDG
jgi:polyferredoxin